MRTVQLLHRLGLFHTPGRRSVGETGQGVLYTGLRAIIPQPTHFDNSLRAVTPPSDSAAPDIAVVGWNTIPKTQGYELLCQRCRFGSGRYLRFGFRAVQGCTPAS